MTVSEIVDKLNLAVWGGEDGLHRPVTGGYVSDLLSDVMGNASDGDVWITLQTHKNVMAVASLKEVAAVILVKGLAPDDDTLEQSNKENIPLLGTKMETFEVAGKLYELLKK
ncbi:DRTGG domain-containing protein [Thermophagus xiamenensis]|jgi:predicted transcriptional regulator|uniref:DRTGG domain-containing protein n=1 Tax=Thermophagus xiamenensis TaxID=385682 RepID=A0A1I1W3K7_9BACT|nr:DRTGG domain-containing protein [Thermophagus xiamenensis]SFD88968.1 DRTGG domain-containing protein [Thermophagus xiamenensis]